MRLEARLVTYKPKKAKSLDSGRHPVNISTLST